MLNKNVSFNDVCDAIKTVSKTKQNVLTDSTFNGFDVTSAGAFNRRLQDVVSSAVDDFMYIFQSFR